MTITTDRVSPRLASKVAAACGTTVLLAGLSACGSSNGGVNPASQAYGQGGGPQTSRNGSDGKPPGVNGKVAAVDGSTAQVQGLDGQVAVTWTGGTTFTKEVGATLADVTVGTCVLVGSAQQPSTGSTPATADTAANVRITPKADGSCSPTLRGPGGSGPGGTGPGGPGPQVQGAPPSGAPGGGQRPQVRMMGGAVGEVTAVSATGFTVASVVPGNNGASPRATRVTVTVSGATTYTTTAAGRASDVKVGVCVTAAGATSDTGAVTADRVAISQPQGGQCGGFMRFRSADGAGSGQES